MNITRESIIEELKMKYPHYNFVATTVTKNGNVIKEAICVKNDSNIAPTIYTEDIIRNAETLGEAVEMISNIIEQNITPDIDISKITDREFILKHVRIGIQKDSDEQLVKKPAPDFEGIEQYLFITEKNHKDTTSSWSVKLKPELLNQAKISEEQLWDIAAKNTFEQTTLKSMIEIISEMTGQEFDDEMASLEPVQMYVISNNDKCRGASAILDRKLLKKFAEEHCPNNSAAKAVAVLPSSIHECILIPVTDVIDIEELDDMVREVNATQVAPEEVLVDRAYVVTFN